MILCFCLLFQIKSAASGNKAVHFKTSSALITLHFPLRREGRGCRGSGNRAKDSHYSYHRFERFSRIKMNICHWFISRALMNIFDNSATFVFVPQVEYLSTSSLCHCPKSCDVYLSHRFQCLICIYFIQLLYYRTFMFTYIYLNKLENTI